MSMPYTIRGLVLVALALCYPVLGLAQPPAMFRGDPAHSGQYRGGGGVIVGLQWRVPTDGDVTSSPVIVGDVVYVGTDDGHLLALDRLTGRTRWRYDAKSAVQSSPAVARGLVFIASRDGVVHAVHASTGTVAWRRPTGASLPFPWGHESGDRYISSAVYSDGSVYIGAGDGYVYSLNAATGQVRWRARTEGRVRATPAVADGRVFAASFDGRVYAFDAASGALRWRYETEGVRLNSANFGFDRRSVQSSPAVANGVVFVGARDGFLYALNATDGTLRWRFDHKVSWVNASPAVANGVVYAGSSDGHFVQAVDAATGAERWRAETGPAIVWSSSAVTDRHVFFGDGAGRLHVADIATGKIVATFRTGAGVFSSPVVDANLVVFGSSDGGVYALRLGGEATTVKRAVFFDSAYTSISSIGNSNEVSAYMKNRGYEVLDATALVSFLEARVTDHAPSVVVFAIDALPAAAAAAPLRTSLVRRYLDAGGKIVWSGIPPMIWPVEPGGKRGGLNELKWDQPEELLGVSHAAAIFDARGVRATESGRRWGLPSRWRSSWAVSPDAVSEVLGLDDWGLASSWVKRFGGPAGTGFVRVDFTDLLGAFLAAEYRPEGR